jgi:hypothetical protein
MGTYEEVTSLNAIIEKSRSLIEEEYQLNFNLQTRFNIGILTEETFPAEAKLAVEFQDPKKPDHLYINHGQHIQENGVTHLIEELKKKKNSNRALLSLINQKDIIDSNDDPIPSFMIVQCSIEEGNKLYFTFYFRALEVSKFLKINLEEMRIIISQIIEDFSDINEVYLNIFAFRAYIKDTINPLIRPKLELLTESQLLKKMEKTSKTELIPLLEEKKSTDSTIVDDESFNKMLRILNDADSNMDIPAQLKSVYTKTIIQKIIDTSNELKILRRKNSHDPAIEKSYTTYKTQIQELIDELAKID